MTRGDLYCWARKISFQQPPDQVVVLLDHTWVTDYPNPGPPLGFTEPIPENKNYWFCWGEFHSAGDSEQNPARYKPFSGPVHANIDEALCICKANIKTDPADASWSHAYLGTVYGQHGVCHQVANRVLWAAGIQRKGKYKGKRVTVEGVQGWQLSWWVYGPYGYKYTSDKWPLPQCSESDERSTSEASEEVTDPVLAEMARPLGERLARRKRNDLQSLRAAMLEEKQQLDDRAERGRMSAIEFADEVNGLVARTLQSVRTKILDGEEFEKLFGVRYRDRLLPLIVDPAIAKAYSELRFRVTGAST